MLDRNHASAWGWDVGTAQTFLFQAATQRLRRQGITTAGGVLISVSEGRACTVIKTPPTCYSDGCSCRAGRGWRQARPRQPPMRLDWLCTVNTYHQRGRRNWGTQLRRFSTFNQRPLRPENIDDITILRWRPAQWASRS